jgi:hypothetical protein
LNAIQDKILSSKYTFKTNDYVWAKKTGTDDLYKGKIANINGDMYTIMFEDGIKILNYCDLYIYFDCKCDTSPLSIKEQILLNYSGEKICELYRAVNTII